MKNCNNCKYKITDKERDVIQYCNVSKAKNDETILILGRKGICPYHEYSENYRWK